MAASTQKGVVAVELALLLVPLTLVLFGTVELGRAFYQYETVVKSTRSAARYLSVQTPGVGIPEAKCMAVAGTANAVTCSPALVPALNTNMVTVRFIDGVSTCPVGVFTGCGAINLVEVCVNCPESAEKLQFVSIAKWLVPDITLRAVRAVMRREGA